jgi:hypothetical protein
VGAARLNHFTERFTLLQPELAYRLEYPEAGLTLQSLHPTQQDFLDQRREKVLRQSLDRFDLTTQGQVARSHAAAAVD